VAIEGGSESVRPRGRASKREAILAASVELFNTLGYDLTSMDAVAARAGVSKTTVYAHFGDKLALYRAMAEKAVTVSDVDFDKLRIDENLTPEEKLTSLATLLVKALTSDTFLAFHRVMILESSDNQAISKGLVPGAPHVVDVVSAILAEDASKFDYEIPDARAHAALFVRIAGASFEIDALLDKNFRPDDNLIEAHSAWVTRMFLRSLRPVAASVSEADSVSPPPPDYPWLADRLYQQPVD